MKLDKKKWTKVKFGDLVEERKLTVDAKSSGLERYIAGEHMASEDVHLKNWGIIGEDYLGPAFHRKFEPGDILYGSRRTYLKKVAVADFEGVTANTTFVLTPKKDVVDERLLPFLMLSDAFTEHSVKNSKGSVNPYINFKDIAKYEFLLPPKDQQARIAELLWAADDVVQKYERVSDQIQNSIRLFTDIELSKDANTGEKWEESPLKKFLKDKPQYGANTPAIPYSENKPRYIRITDIDDEGNLMPEGIVTTSLDDFSNYQLVEGDFLFARTGNTVGKTYLYKKEDGLAMFAGYLIRCKLNTKVLLPDFLALFCKSSKYDEFKKRTVKVGAQPNINAEQYANMSIPDIPIERQQKITNRYNALVFALAKNRLTQNHSKLIQKQLINQVFG